MKRASPEMITTGQVGAYLTGAAWGVLFFAMILGTAGQLKESSLWSAGVGGGLVFILLWVGGCVCEGIGWIGLARMRGALAGTIGWITCTLPATYFLLLMVGAAFDGPGILYVVILVQVSLYVLVLVHILGRRERAVKLPVAVGLVLAIVGILGLTIAASNLELGPSAVLFYVTLSGMALTHLALASYFRMAAREARALDVFA